MFGFKIRRQYGIENFILDFYCPKLKLAIEIDGDVHHFKEKQILDSKKNDLLKTEGIELVRLNNNDFEEDYESVVLHLEDIFKKRARKQNFTLNEKPQ